MEPRVLPYTNAALTANRSESTPTRSLTDTSETRQLALAALGPLSGAAIAPSYEIAILAPCGPIALPVSPDGNQLQRLGYTCFHHSMQEAFERYRRWLVCIAEGQPFPTNEIARDE
jgi:hypothetical protein